MATTILHKKSSTASAVPTDVQLTLGELALNTTDGKVYMKKGDDSVVEVGATPTTLELTAFSETANAIATTGAVALAATTWVLIGNLEVA